MPSIFMSYRRGYNELIVGRLYDRLLESFGYQQVFKEIKTDASGAAYRSVVEESLDKVDHFLVIIGPEWLTATNHKGERLIHDPLDPVHIEVDAALRKPNTRVIPVLVGGAKMPERDDLPLPMKDLQYRNPYPIREDPTFNSDVQRLINRLSGTRETVEARYEIPESRGCAYSSRGLVTVLTILAVLVGAFFVMNLLGYNPLALVGILGNPAPTEETRPQATIPPLATPEPIAGLRVSSGGGFVRAEPHAGGAQLYTAAAGRSLQAVAQIRTDDPNYVTWVLVELPDDDGHYGWIWIGAFEDESQAIGLDLPFYDTLSEPERYPIGS